MKRNLSSQAIKAMAIGMAVTMGSTTALSGVAGTVVAKADEAFFNARLSSNVNTSSEAPKEGDIITTPSGDMFKVLTPASTELQGKSTNTVQLISFANIDSSQDVGRRFDGTFENGVVTVKYDINKEPKTITFDVTEIGNTTKAITTNRIENIDVLNSYISKSTKINAKAFEGATLSSSTVAMIIPETVTDLGATSLQLTDYSRITIKVPGYKTDASLIEQSELVAAIGTTSAYITLELPYSVISEELQNLKEALKSNAPNVVVKTSTANTGATAPTENQTIVTKTGDIFKVLTAASGETPGTVALVELGNPKSQNTGTFDGTFSESLVTVNYDTASDAKVANFKITQLGDGTNPIKTGYDLLSIDTLAPYLVNVTKIAQNALKNVNINANPKFSMTIPQTVTTVDANSLQLSNSSAIVIKVPSYGANNDTQITKDELVSAIGTTSARITLELPHGTNSKEVADLIKTTAPNVVVRTELSQNPIGETVKATNGKGTYTFQIIEQVTSAEDLTNKNKVALVGFTPEKTVSTKDAHAVLSGNIITINGNQYSLTQLGDGTNPTEGITVDCLENLTNNITTIANNAFKGNQNITSISSTNKNDANTLYLPAVTQIGDGAFAEATALTSVQLPTITTIGNDTFNGATSLSTVNLDAVTSVGNGAFAGTTALTSIELPQVTSVGDNAFKGTTALTTVNLPQATSVGNGAFADTTALTTVNLPQATSIGASAFENATNLTEAKLPEANSIGNSAFKNTKLETVNLPKAETIGDSAFEGLTSLTTVTLPEAKSIGNSAFQGTNLNKVDLPNTEKIGANAFNDTEVSSINVPKATSIGEQAFANNEKLTDISIGTKVDGSVSIPSNALIGSTNITSVSTNSSSKDQVTEAIKESGTKNDVTLSTDGSTDTIKPSDKPSNSGISGGGANIGTSGGGSGSSNTTTETTTNKETSTETTTESTTENNTQTTENKTLSLDIVSLPSVEGEALSFSDVANDYWAKPHIDKLSTAGIISGSNGKFNPNGKTKRADVAVMLVKLLGLTPQANNNFTDVDANEYYAPYVGTASSYNIVNGSNGMFKPEAIISRQDTMVMIAQVLKGLNLNINTDTTSLDQFSDVNSIASYAQESVAILVNSDIISGNNGKLNPTKSVTRAEMATIMSKLYDLIASAK